MTPAHGVWALDGAGPYPCDDRGVGAVGEFDLGVNVSDALKGAGFHPLAVVIYVFGESFGIYLCGLAARMGNNLANHFNSTTGMECLRCKCMASHVRC